MQKKFEILLSFNGTVFCGMERVGEIARLKSLFDARCDVTDASVGCSSDQNYRTEQAAIAVKNMMAELCGTRVPIHGEPSLGAIFECALYLISTRFTGNEHTIKGVIVSEDVSPFHVEVFTHKGKYAEAKKERLADVAARSSTGQAYVVEAVS